MINLPEGIAMYSSFYNDFLFAKRYRFWRHVVFWLFDITIWATFWTLTQNSFWRNVSHMLVWFPVFVLYSYPLIYWLVPKVLLKGKHVWFFAIVLLWGAAGWFINIYYRLYVFIPFQEVMGYNKIIRGGPMPGSYLCLTTTAASTVVIAIFRQWTMKQQQWLHAEKEKITAELQLLKAQVHPHFLFNTLNNIYSFSMENSPKTPQLILKLSSLLRYMLYDCKEEEVLLEKETEIMKNYIDLEKERYGNKIDISWNIRGDVKDKFIAPLLLLPFLENAFKHGTSEQLEIPWLSVELSVEKNIMYCKILNSKNAHVPFSSNGIGINNVKKRLEFIYPTSYELKLSDNENFFSVSLVLDLEKRKLKESISSLPLSIVRETAAI